MRHVYDVKFEIRYEGIKDWMPDSVHVLGNGDASKAVEAVRRKELKGGFEDTVKGKIVWRKARGFRMTGVEQLTHVNY